MRATSARSASPRLPNLIVAGVSRAGTTSLFHYLRQHSEVSASDVKELRYFTPLRYGAELAPAETYADHFRWCAGTRYWMEATPGYFYGGRPLARGITQVCPADSRVVVSLRSPVDRCWSWFAFVKSRLRLPPEMTFEEYVERCLELHDAGTDDRLEHQPYWGVGGGCYATWLDSWVEELGDRFRLLFFEDLTTNPAGVTRDLFGWLGLDQQEVGRIEFDVQNKSRQYHYQLLHRAAVIANRRTEAFFHRHPRSKRLIRRGYYAMNRGKSESAMSPEMRARLNEFYRPHNQQLAHQLAPLGLTLPAAWLGSSECSETRGSRAVEGPQDLGPDLGAPVDAPGRGGMDVALLGESQSNRGGLPLTARDEVDQAAAVEGGEGEADPPRRRLGGVGDSDGDPVVHVERRVAGEERRYVAVRADAEHQHLEGP